MTDSKRVTRKVKFRGTEDQLSELLRIFAEHGVDAKVDTPDSSEHAEDPDYNLEEP